MILDINVHPSTLLKFYRNGLSKVHISTNILNIPFKGSFWSMIYASYTAVRKNITKVGPYRHQTTYSFFFLQNYMWHIINTDILHMYLTPNTYCVTSGLPACRTDLPVSVRVLEGLDQSQRLVHGAPNREIIHGDLAQRSFRINDKQTPEKNPTNTISW